MPHSFTAVTLALSLLLTACQVDSTVAYKATVPDQSGSYKIRPWVVPASASYLGAASQPGELQPEPSTPHSLSLRWPIKGDDNGNAVVKVFYRVTPHGAWQEGLPLFWVHPERAPDYLQVPDGRLFAGSIVDLAPDTSYQVRLELKDPDGGSTSREVTLATTAEPAETVGLRARHVVPDPNDQGGGSGSVEDPFRGLATALDKAVAGDLVLLQGGVYKAGGTVVSTSGLPGQPIVLRAAGDGDVILDGGGQESLINVSNQSHVWFEQLTFRNATKLIKAHKAEHIVIRRNRFEVALKNKATGVDARNTTGLETTGFFVTDNVFRRTQLLAAQVEKEEHSREDFRCRDYRLGPCDRLQPHVKTGRWHQQRQRRSHLGQRHLQQ